ncbi:MAG: hypothetical protein WBQ25_12555 [Nitrososphaeraceae archaeon]
MRQDGYILQWLSHKYKPFKSTKILALCGFDAYSGSLKFVFGEAYVDGGGISVIYLPRLRQEFYRSKPDKSLFHLNNIPIPQWTLYCKKNRNTL